MGIITLSSSCPACAASVTVRSLPSTWNIAMSSISASTGLTLPGMIDDPGCTAGSRISSNPVAGPEESRRKSLAMRIKSCANVRTAPEKNTASEWACIDSNKLSDSYNFKRVNSLNFLIMRV